MIFADKVLHHAPVGSRLNLSPVGFAWNVSDGVCRDFTGMTMREFGRQLSGRKDVRANRRRRDDGDR